MKTISNISAPASILGFIIIYLSSDQYQKFNIWQIILLFIFLISSIIIIYVDIKKRPKKYKNEREINDYMLKWISNIGRIVIFTRDMSWANESIIRNKLSEKARNSELTICMPKANQFAKDLQQEGARIIEYSNINYVPQSRFTIVHFERNDAKVAIGKTYKDVHIIEEFSNGAHPLFHVAQDLVNILIKANEAGRNL